MAFIGETIYEDYLYKFTGKRRSILWSKGNPWRQKYFVIKRVGNKPVLEFFNKKPKSRHSGPKGKVELWPSFRVEKVTNMKNRAYVFQITTPDTTICLSTDEQRSMDIFVFFLQIQTRLKDQIRDDYFPVHPENSEAQRRIGAKGTNCILHISPYGITLALQSNRSVLAQWPLKSIRSYESSENGQLSLEAGRVAPMGDGMYIFGTELGFDNQMYDLVDRYVLDALEQVMPGQRGGSLEIEDYVIEAERLLGLTTVSACTPDNPDIRNILRENWSTDIQTPSNVARNRQVVHTRLTAAESMNSLNSQNSSSMTGSQSVPARLLNENGSVRNSPQVPRSLPGFQSPQALPYQNSPSAGGPRRGSNQSQPSLADRPPAPPPSATIPMKTLQHSMSQSGGQYLRMNSAASRTPSSNPGSPFTPTSADWVSPPTFRDVMRQQSPISESGAYQLDSYLTPTEGAAIVTSTPINNHQQGASGKGFRESYLTPLSVSQDKWKSSSTKNSSIRPNNSSAMKSNHVKKELKLSPKHELRAGESNVRSPGKVRARRLRSASCEDLSDYLRLVMYDPISKSMNDLLDETSDGEEYCGPEPFPRLQSFSGVLDRGGEEFPESSYNIDGLKGKIYDGPSLPVSELRKKFSKRSLSRIRRSVSNPNFIGSLSLEKLNLARVNIGITHSSPNESRSSLVNMLPESLKKHLNKESSHKRSNGALSSGAASKNSSRSGSRASSAQVSPYNTLKHVPKEDIVAPTSVKGINVTRRSRSFRRQKPTQGENGNQTYDSKGEQSRELESENKGGNSSATSKESSNKKQVNTQQECVADTENKATNSSQAEGKAGQLNQNKSVKEMGNGGNAVELTLSDLDTSAKLSKQTPKVPKVAPKPRQVNTSAKTAEEEKATSEV